jgi:hypothetical protein
VRALIVGQNRKNSIIVDTPFNDHQMKVHYILSICFCVSTIVHADLKPKALTQQISEAITSGHKLEFGDADQRFGITFVGPSESESKITEIEPLFLSVGTIITRLGGHQDSIKECQDRITSYCKAAKNYGTSPHLKLYVHYKHDESLLRALLDHIASERVELVWIHIATKEEMFKNSRIELPLPRPLPIQPKERAIRNISEAQQAAPSNR